MTAYSDPKLAFYLEHKALIDEWAELRSLEIETAHAALGPAADALASALQQSLPAQSASIDRHLSDQQRVVGLYRPAWIPSDGGTPRVMIAFSWYQEDVSLSDRATGTLLGWASAFVAQGSIGSCTANWLASSSTRRRYGRSFRKTTGRTRGRATATSPSKACPTKPTWTSCPPGSSTPLRSAFDLVAPIVDDLIS